MEPVTQQKNVVTEMVLPLGHVLMVLVFVASVSVNFQSYIVILNEYNHFLPSHSGLLFILMVTMCCELKLRQK